MASYDPRKVPRNAWEDDFQLEAASRTAEQEVIRRQRLAAQLQRSFRFRFAAPSSSDGAPTDERTALLPKKHQAAIAGGTGGTIEPRGSTGPAGSRKSQSVVLVYSAVLLVTAVANSIFFKKMTDAMPNYPYFLGQFTTLVYVPVFFGLVFWQLRFTNLITPEMTEFPKSRFCWMGVFDSISGLLVMFGAVHTSGSTQALLANAVIPITMVLAYFMIGTQFRLKQYMGAGTILMGVAVVLIPTFLDPDGQQNAGDLPLFNMLFLLGVVPGAFSSIYKEMAFGEVDIDVNYLQAWVALFQCFVGIFLMPLNSFKLLGENYVPLSRLPSTLWSGTLCMLGVDTITEDCYTERRIPGLPPCDECSGAWIMIAVYLLFNCAFNVFSVLVIKHGSAAYLSAVMTLRIPLVQLIFSLRLVQNPPDVFTLWSFAGLLLIVAGLMTYRWGDGEEGARDGQEDVVVPAAGGNAGLLMGLSIRRRQMKHTRRDGHQLRSNLYSRLGIIDTPMTPTSLRNADFSPRPLGTPQLKPAAPRTIRYASLDHFELI